MRKAVVFAVIVAMLPIVAPRPARAGASTDAALALGAFAVFNQFVTGHTIFQEHVWPRPAVAETVVVQAPPRVIYAPPPVVYVPGPPVVYAPAPPVVYAPPPVVAYPSPYYAVRAYPRYYGGGYWRGYHRGDDD